jgi:hypothetical protein
MKKTLALALALATAPFAAPAAELSYTFLEGGYAKFQDGLDYSPLEMDGGYARGSLDIAEGVNLLGSVSRVSDDVRLGGGYEYQLDVTQYEVGVGYHMGMGDRIDFVSELAWTRVDFDSETFDDHANGGRGAIGVRGAFNDVVEGSLKVNYYDGGDFEGGFAGVLGAQFRINPTWGITAEVEHGELLLSDEDTRYAVGVRASF